MLHRHSPSIALALALLACGPAPSANDPRPPNADKVSGRANAEPARVEPSPPTPTPSPSEKPAPSPPPTADTPSPPPTSTASAEPPPPSEPPPIPPNTVVLHIGDSFLLAGFAQALKPRMKALGVRYEVRSEQSSYTTTWAGKMELLVQNTQPDLVIINLGANEIANTDPPTHASAVRRIVKGIAGRPCVWVSPPLWRKDTGIINVIRENSAPCRFFDSDRLVPQPIPRIGDKIHPTILGGAEWAKAFWNWLHAERVPAEPTETPDASQNGASKRNPWLLKPSPPDEHIAKPYAGPGSETHVMTPANAARRD